jgi:RNA polymerase sigma-70 factor (ECF subfamily)
VANETREQRFEAILRETQSRIRAYIAGLGMSSVDVDDLSQEVYLVLYKDLEKIPPELEPVRWLKGVARNLCMNHFRKAKVSRQHAQEIVETLATVSIQPGFSDEEDISARLSVCLGKLAPQSRDLLRLRYEEEKTSDAVAKIMNLTGSAIRMSLLRVRMVLRDCLRRSLERESAR